LDTILKGTHPRTIPARFGVIWFSGFRGKSVERKISQKNPEYMLNYSLPLFVAEE
jgi:hypothetical protein